MFRKSGNAVLFCLGIYLVINVIVAFQLINHVNLPGPHSQSNNYVEILSWMALLWLIASIVILLKAIITREKFDNRLKWASGLLLAVLGMSIVMGFL